ncbi:DNA polymerase III, epsilon subunit [Formosa agariphila KMM 3901]|uniref:DNA polymerase III, epsilon subunit n=1 Tax=Formosa agariphila (strain DSM 15362 / KCTC 12365 / LMG 23005 / KMM 3901 / M-2Alg 35-1) TaxID=1347342 RepID=T2KKL9_FORAG|nr:exonuclease domain-containing protein [Formosa agariphila]CDF78559.1 DNA polymerase III, epsilon subunit [Formosa agariphila KMM 3901]
MIYTIIDIETTGSGNKITEIAILKHDGTQVIEEFTSLVNPEAYIPEYITALTGIDNSMVADAPTFSEIAQQVLDITEDTVFVAHNVNFDYNIIRNAFKALDIEFKRKKLCTIRLSRKLLPGHQSYSLGKLCTSLNIEVFDRHRAKGDAEATVILFELLLAQEQSEAIFKDFLKPSSKEATLPPNLPSSIFNAIPNKPGVYYFKNKKGTIIYVGKAKDLKKRVLSHFYNKSAKEMNLCRETADITFDLSGSELIALLMEDAAIKEHYPEFNQAAKRNPKAYAVFSYEDRDGIKHLAYNTLKSAPNPLQIYYSITDCREQLEKFCKAFNLCPKYCHLQEVTSSCSHYAIQDCKGICKQEEDAESYNQRVNEAITAIRENNQDIILKQTGRHTEESAFILIKDGYYKGYGFIDSSEQVMHNDELDRFLIPQKDTMHTQKILQSVLLKHSNNIFQSNSVAI